MTKEEAYNKNRYALGVISEILVSYSKQEIGVYNLVASIREQLERSVDTRWDELDEN